MAKNVWMYARSQPNCRAVLYWDSPCLLLELEVSISGCQAHTPALCSIWIYQSTELNAAREKHFSSDELFSFLVWINKRPLPLLLVSKLWGKKCLKYLHNAWAIEAPLLAPSLQMAICWCGSMPTHTTCARAWHMSNPNIGHGLQNYEPVTAFH